MLRSTRGSLVHNGGEAGAPALGDDQTMCSGAFRTPDNCTEVVRVADFVAYNNKRILSALFSQCKDLVDRAVVPHRADGDNPLVCLGDGHKVKFSPVTLHHNDSRVSGFGGNMAQRFVHIPFVDVDLVDASLGTKCLYHGISALYNIIFQFIFIFIHSILIVAQHDGKEKAFFLLIYKYFIEIFSRR